jgi:hypothetical protein
LTIFFSEVAVILLFYVMISFFAVCVAGKQFFSKTVILFLFVNCGMDSNAADETRQNNTTLLLHKK